jgi:hypothetical protein
MGTRPRPRLHRTLTGRAAPPYPAVVTVAAKRHGQMRWHNASDGAGRGMALGGPSVAAARCHLAPAGDAVGRRWRGQHQGCHGSGLLRHEQIAPLFARTEVDEDVDAAALLDLEPGREGLETADAGPPSQEMNRRSPTSSTVSSPLWSYQSGEWRGPGWSRNREARQVMRMRHPLRL